MTLSIFYWASFALLLGTKAADVLSTIRFVSPSAETNPLARSLFRRFGFKPGIMIVSAVFLLIAGTQYALVWWFCTPLVQTLNAALGALIAWVQWDVARFNKTGTHSTVTRLALHSYRVWTRRMKE